MCVQITVDAFSGPRRGVTGIGADIERLTHIVTSQIEIRAQIHSCVNQILIVSVAGASDKLWWCIWRFISTLKTPTFIIVKVDRFLITTFSSRVVESTLTISVAPVDHFKHVTFVLKAFSFERGEHKCWTAGRFTATLVWQDNAFWSGTIATIIIAQAKRVKRTTITSFKCAGTRLGVWGITKGVLLLRVADTV